MLSRQEEEAERLETLRNDARLREQQKAQDPIDEREVSERIVERSRMGLRGQQGSTYADHTAIEVNIPGRHAVTPHIVGQTAQPYADLPALPDNSPSNNENDPDVYWPKWRAEQKAKLASPGVSGPATPIARARFAVDEPYVVGSTPISVYPSARQAADTGQEPPLGSDNPALDQKE